MNMTLKGAGRAVLVAAAISGFSGCAPKVETPAVDTPQKVTTLVVDHRQCRPKDALFMQDHSAMVGNKSWAVRYTAAISLGESCDSRAITPLLFLLGDKHAIVRATALYGLDRVMDTLKEDGSLGSLAVTFSRLMPAFEKVLSPGPNLTEKERVEAVFYIASMQKTVPNLLSIAVLKGARHDSSYLVSQAAENALRTMLDPGNDV